MEWLGNTYETTQLKYWEFEHHGTQKRQYEWVKKQQTTSHIDLRWKDALTKKQSKLISSNRDLRSYFEQNKLFQIEKGITKL